MYRFREKIFSLLLVAINAVAFGQKDAPRAHGPVPSENQLRWQEMEYYAFIHYSINTYTDQEWGDGSNDPRLFNPSGFDARQWARVAKEAGMKGIILTAKHHDGFCLWPSEYTEYSVKNSPWKNGQGDLVKEVADACKEYGLKLGIYLSPWDRNRADYGHAGYITYFRNQLTELLTNYGEIFEVWFDGANGGTGYYGGARENRKIDRTTYYDWLNTYKLIRELQPKAVIWNDNGDRADLRWVGTEEGYVGETNWSLLYAGGDVPENMLRYGVENGEAWVPGEVNTSIRPGWFYHEYEDSRVKNLPRLMETYYKSIGRNAPLLLNFPIDRRGLIHENDEREVLAFARAVKEAFAVNLAKKAKITASNVRGKNYAAAHVTRGKKDSYWATEDQVTSASLTLDFGRPTEFNRFVVQEYIRLGQRVKAFRLEALVNNEWKELKDQWVTGGSGTTTIGYKRIIGFPTVKARKLRFTITDSKASPLISAIEVYHAPQILTPPKIVREKSGAVHISSGDKASEIFYTTDGSVPGTGSQKYSEVIPTGSGKVTVKAVAFNASAGKSSPVAAEEFDVSRKDWKVLSSADEKAASVLDGNINSAWYQEKSPDIVIDLGAHYTLSGFKYLPGQHSTAGVITHYQFFVSKDNQNWTLADEGEFSNIRNNPLWQVKNFRPAEARYIKLKAVKSTGNRTGYAELDVITK